MKKTVSIFMVLVMVIGLFAGCAQTSAEAPAAEKTAEDGEKYIAIISKGYQHEFWKTVELGAEKAANDLGVRMSFEGPDNESMVDVQVGMVENAITKKADAIMLAALDTKALVGVVEQAKEAGIPVIMFDSDVDSDIPLSFVATDNKAAGAIAADAMAEAIGGKGQVAVVAHNEGTSTAIERRDGFLEKIEADYPEIEVVSVQYSDGDHIKALTKATDIMTSNPELKGIYATNEGSAIGVATAVAEKEKAGIIKVIGFDSSEAEINFLQDGVITGFVVQAPFNMGLYGVQSAVKAINGEAVESRIDTGATFVSLDNFDNEDVQKLLYPLGK